MWVTYRVSCNNVVKLKKIDGRQLNGSRDNFNVCCWNEDRAWLASNETCDVVAVENCSISDKRMVRMNCVQAVGLPSASASIHVNWSGRNHKASTLGNFLLTRSLGLARLITASIFGSSYVLYVVQYMHYVYLSNFLQSTICSHMLHTRSGASLQYSAWYINSRLYFHFKSFLWFSRVIYASKGSSFFNRGGGIGGNIRVI